MKRLLDTPKEADSRKELRKFMYWKPTNYTSEDSLRLVADFFKLDVGPAASISELCEMLNSNSIPSAPEADIRAHFTRGISKIPEIYLEQLKSWSPFSKPPQEWSPCRPEMFSDTDMALLYDTNNHSLFYILTWEEKLLLVKRKGDLGPEIFGGLLAQTLKGYTCKFPVIQVYEPESKENVELVEGIQRLSLTRYEAYTDHPELDNIVLMESKKASLLIEYVPGKTLEGIEDPESAIGSDPNNFYGQIGEILCFDMLINNWDRFPVSGIWEHEGNAGNLMISEGNAWAIDNALGVLEDVDAYVEKVERFTMSVLEGDLSPLDSLDNFLRLHLREAFDPSKHLHNIISGWRRAAQLIVSSPPAELLEPIQRLCSTNKMPTASTQILAVAAVLVRLHPPDMSSK